MSFYQVYEMVTPYLIVGLIGFITWMIVSANKEIDRAFQPIEKEKNTDIHE
ncbi:hypothetical protein [Priestia aryabhattai]|uniref:hypothetical protein n=1 Tax=Priestia aryabhattai TaxID=412384 RepID=UPI002E251CEE|nr:hypothetical protein [Priestia aryabhattai]